MTEQKTIFDQSVEIECDRIKKMFVLLFLGSAAYDSVRSLSYQEADVFLLCYKISDPVSLYNVREKWSREIRQFRPDAPVVLCGCQGDLRDDPQTAAQLSKLGRNAVSREQALAICCEIEAVNYVETCAKALNAFEAFELCALAVIKANKKKTPSIGSQSSFGAKSNSSLKKKLNLNLSFSGSENSSEFRTIEEDSVVKENDDVFPPSSPHFGLGRKNNKSHHRSSLCTLKSPLFEEHQHPLHASTSKNSSRSSSVLFYDETAKSKQAQVRSNGLSRRTSFRSANNNHHHQQPQPIPVASPTVSEVKFNQSSNSNNNNKGIADLTTSLKSHASSVGSTGSSQASSTASSTSTAAGVITTVDGEEIIPVTDDPELLSQLRFMSPKSGVFRPVENNGGGLKIKGRKSQQNCSIM